jgi:signal transduction histidine kinase
LVVVPPLRRDAERSYSSAIATALAGQPTSGPLGEGSGGIRYVAVPIGSGPIADGAVVVSYSDGPIERNVHRLWTALGLFGVTVVILAGLLGEAVARSVTRPLSRLERAAAAFGHGDLEARISDERGPVEVRSLAETFNTMADRVADLVESQRGFIADASHQLRSPLTALRLRLEGIDTDDAATTTDLDAALREVHRLSRLVDGLLALARADGSGVVDRQPVDVVTVAHERTVAWSPLADERGVHLDVDAPLKNTIVVSAVVGSLEQVLDNLIANAIDVSLPGGTVTIAVEPNAEAVQVRVSDDGPGMSAEEQAHAFDRFWHGRSKGRNGGTGLGLAIVRQLTLASGGTVELRDREGGGLVVLLEFPLDKGRR